MTASASPHEAAGRRAAPDPGLRKRAKRSGRETGCWTYIDGESLQRAGFTPGGDLPYYRVTGYQRSKNAGSAIVSLFCGQ